MGSKNCRIVINSIAGATVEKQAPSPVLPVMLAECSDIIKGKSKVITFVLCLGNAEDDAKLKKCVSTRYATVLILLTVKCKYRYQA